MGDSNSGDGLEVGAERRVFEVLLPDGWHRPQSGSYQVDGERFSFDEMDKGQISGPRTSVLAVRSVPA